MYLRVTNFSFFRWWCYLCLFVSECGMWAATQTKKNKIKKNYSFLLSAIYINYTVKRRETHWTGNKYTWMYPVPFPLSSRKKEPIWWFIADNFFSWPIAMGHQRKEKKRKSSTSICSGGGNGSIDTGSSLYYYWSGGARQEVDNDKNKVEIETRGNPRAEEEVTTMMSTTTEQEAVTTLTTTATTATNKTSAPGPEKSNNGDDDLFIRESVFGHDVDNDDDDIRCCHYNDSCSCHQPSATCTNATTIDHCPHQQNQFEKRIKPCRSICHSCSSFQLEEHLKGPGTRSAVVGTRSRNETEAEMFRCNNKNEEQLQPENSISSSSSCNLSRSRKSGRSRTRNNMSATVSGGGGDTKTTIATASSTTTTQVVNDDLGKMVRKKKNVLAPAERSSTTTTTSSSYLCGVQSYSSSITKDSEWKRKKTRRSIKRDTDEVDMSSVDESVPRLRPPLRQLNTASTSTTTTISTFSSSCSPLNNLVSCFTSWPFIVEKYIRLEHLFMTPEAKSVPFRERSKTLDKCGTSHFDGGDQLDRAKKYRTTTTTNKRDNHHSSDGQEQHPHLYFPTTVNAESCSLKESREFVQADLLENCCRYPAIYPSSTKKNNHKAAESGCDPTRREQKHEQHCPNQQPEREKRPILRSRKPSSLPLLWIIALVTGSWINPCFAQGKIYYFFLTTFPLSPLNRMREQKA